MIEKNGQWQRRYIIYVFGYDEVTHVKGLYAALSRLFREQG